VYKKIKNKILFPQSKIISLDEFLKVMEVEPLKFAGTILTIIYKIIFIWSSDLKYEYLNYYSIEYDSFEKYLFWVIGIDLKELENLNYEKKHLFFFDEDYIQFLDSAYDPNYLDTIIETLEKLDESKN
jgi:hypothetical protein